MDADCVEQALESAFQHMCQATPLADAAADVIALVRPRLPDKIDLAFVPSMMSPCVDELEDQVRALFSTEPPDEDVNGLMFGLFEAVSEPSGRTECRLYLCGSNRFDPNSEDWAVSPIWWPEGRYLRSTLNQRLSELRPTDNSDAAWLIECALIEPLLMLCIGELIERLGPDVLLRDAEARGIGLGYDSGDAHVLGVLTPDGLITRETLNSPWDDIVEEIDQEEEEEEEEEGNQDHEHDDNQGDQSRGR
jgi:hypothetical protein